MSGHYRRLPITASDLNHVNFKNNASLSSTDTLHMPVGVPAKKDMTGMEADFLKNMKHISKHDMYPPFFNSGLDASKPCLMKLLHISFLKFDNHPVPFNA